MPWVSVNAPDVRGDAQGDSERLVVVVVVLFNVHMVTGVARAPTTSLGVLGRAKLWYYIYDSAPIESNSKE